MGVTSIVIEVLYDYLTLRLCVFARNPIKRTMNYTQRLATPEDARKIAPLWKAFAIDRAVADVSMKVREEYDFEQYITRQLEHPFTYGFVLEYGQGEVVGFLFTYAYDEAPQQGEERGENPFQSRRVGSVLGLYVQEEHRKPATIKLLVDAVLAKGKELKLSDIDLLISGEQTGIHRLLERYGFKKGAIQYTLHYDNSGETDLPSLYAPHREVKVDEAIKPGQIPLRDPKTHELVRNSQGDVVFLVPVRDEVGEILKSSTGLPIYPTP